jgi:uncharacterized protein YndB with AHSA1/START domain
MTMTKNQPSVVDRGEFTVRRTITIAAAPEKVWAAITEPEHIVGWFGQGATIEQVAVGADGVFSFDGWGDFAVRIEELDAPRMIAYRWRTESATALDPDHSTVFRFTLEPQGAGTQLTVVESGFNTLPDPAASMESNRGGWDAELDELVAYLEDGS